MATKLYDLAVVTRRYTDSAGQDKSVWENVGAILQADSLPYMMLKAHFLPAAISRKEGSESIVVSMFTPKDSSNPDAYDAFNYDGTAGRRLYDLAVGTRRWQTQNGEQRTSWLNVGTVIQGKDGRPYMMLKAHFNPAGIQRKDGSESISVSLFKPKPKDAQTDSFSAQDDFEEQDDFSPQPFDPDGPIPF